MQDALHVRHNWVMIGLIVVQGQHGNHQERDAEHRQIERLLDALSQPIVNGHPAEPWQPDPGPRLRVTSG